MESEKKDMLSMKALKWLHSNEVDYKSKNHEERMTLIKTARILYPDDD